MRTQLLNAATDAMIALADAAPFIPPIEAEVRMHCHDILHGDHDKDFRCLAAFPLDKLKDKSMYVWRINRLGHLDIDVLVSTRSSEFHEVALVIHRRHMRVITLYVEI